MANEKTNVNALPVQPNRAEIEARRGIVRDGNGKIMLSKDQKKKRIVHLEAKKADLANRVKNINAELKTLKAEV